MEKPILGQIDCPTCGEKMRITTDKNGDPFGYCAGNCRQQLRIGGDPYRVRAFLARFPWAAPAPVTVTEPETAKKPEESPATVTNTCEAKAGMPAGPARQTTAPAVTAKKTAPRRATFADALQILGGR